MREPEQSRPAPRPVKPNDPRLARLLAEMIGLSALLPPIEAAPDSVGERPA